MDFYEGVRDSIGTIITQLGLENASKEELLDHIVGDLNFRIVFDASQLVYNNLTGDKKEIYSTLYNEGKYREAGDFATKNCPDIDKLFKDLTDKYLEIYS